MQNIRKSISRATVVYDMKIKSYNLKSILIFITETYSHFSARSKWRPNRQDSRVLPQQIPAHAPIHHLRSKQASLLHKQLQGIRPGAQVPESHRAPSLPPVHPVLLRRQEPGAGAAGQHSLSHRTSRLYRGRLGHSRLRTPAP